MRRLFAWALFNALIGCGAVAAANEGTLVNLTGGDVTQDVAPCEPIVDEARFYPVCDTCGDDDCLGTCATTR
ncbi:MAG: hypothetical protein QM811_30360 [Pirellulales bacterium]